MPVTWEDIHRAENNIAGPMARREPIERSLAANAMYQDSLTTLLELQDAQQSQRTMQRVQELYRACFNLSVAVAEDKLDVDFKCRSLV